MGYTIYLQGLPVTQNVSWGIIISTRSLVLQRVGRVHSGFYACSAANDRGETQSALVNLRIRCKWKMVLKKHVVNNNFDSSQMGWMFIHT